MTGIEFAVVAIWVAVTGIGLAILVPAPLGRTAAFAALALSGVAAAGAGIDALAGSVSTGGLPFAHIALRIDALAGFFLLIIGAVAVATGVFGLGGRNADERRTGRTAAAAACAIFSSCLVICLADDTLLFIFGWEALALGFYWAIAYAGTDESGPSAGYFSLLVTHAAGAGLIAAFFAAAVHGAMPFRVSAVATTIVQTPGVAGAVLFVLVLVAFGAKVGLFPLHLWLRLAYPAAPSCVAALMAGGALNVGFYGLVRFLLAPGLPVPLWYGIIILTLGAVGAFLGIAWAMSETDLRALAAYSSVENAGIILAALGAALVGRTLSLPFLTGVALAAALLQITAHAFAKALLFLSCATVRNATGTTVFGEIGGLARRLRIVTITTFVAALSLAALPPTAGFVSEWTTLEMLMQAFRTGNPVAEVTFALAAAAIGIAAGVAIVAFAKFLGAGFLGSARARVERAKPIPTNAARALGLVLPALAVAGVGIWSTAYLRIIAPAIDRIAGVPSVEAIVGIAPLVQPGFAKFSSIAPAPLLLVILGFALVFWLISATFRRPPARRVPAWTSGEAYRVWAVYTGTGVANASRVILDAATRIQRLIGGSLTDAGPDPMTYRSAPRPYFGMASYRLVAVAFERVGDVVRWTQSGAIAAYLSYILIFTIALLLLYPSMRHW